jgi:nucleoid-associated protein YgaU
VTFGPLPTDTTTAPATRPATHPATTHPAATSAATQPATYKVKAGDTLRKIAKSLYGDEAQWKAWIAEGK